ncbi:MAG: hypothetical protein AAB426_12945 [Myxococcota bacterium]
MRMHTIYSWAALSVGALTLGGCYINGTPNWEIEHEEYTPVPTSEYIPPAVSDPSSTATTRRVVLLHTNDEHSHFLGFGPNSEYPFLPGLTPEVVATRIATGVDTRTVGGIVRRQFLINKIREESADPVLVLSAGDMTMGTMFHFAMVSGSGAPELVAMAMMGYDVATLGNHELDFGPDILANALRLANDTTFGGAVPFVASNINFEDVTDGGTGSALASMYGAGGSGAPVMPWTTKTLSNGLKVGFVGLMGYEAALVAAGKSPISFSVPLTGSECAVKADCTGEEAGFGCVQSHCVDPLDEMGAIQAIAADAQEQVNELRNNQGVDLVVALSHLGAVEDPYLAQLTHGIDVIIGGHSHTETAPTVIPSLTSGQSIVVQAGWYGRKLGQLVITVAPDGTVGFEAENAAGANLVQKGSTLHAVDYHLDAQIAADTEAFTRALSLTAAVIAPVVEGVDDNFAATLGAHMLDPVARSDHDIVGEVSSADSNLSHLFTDAVLATASAGMCPEPSAADPIVVVQANGVLRESLLFGNPTLAANFTPDAAGLGSTTLADVFRVVPLGPSPYQYPGIPGDVAHPARQVPGFPLVTFRLTPAQLIGGATIGATKGLESDSFFLSYAGMRVSYAVVDGTPAVVKMELGTDADDYAHVLFDAARTPRWEDETGAAITNPADPSQFTVRIVTNLYLAGFLNAFGIAPLDGDGVPIQEDAVVEALGLDSILAQTVLCRTGIGTRNCNPGNPQALIGTCYALSGDTAPWAEVYSLGELKEWTTLLGAVATHTFATDEYAGATPTSPRVVNLTP